MNTIKPTYQEEHTSTIAVWHDDLSNKVVIARAHSPHSRIEIDHMQLATLIDALANPNTARAILRPADLERVGQNLMAVWAGNVARAQEADAKADGEAGL